MTSIFIKGNENETKKEVSEKLVISPAPPIQLLKGLFDAGYYTFFIPYRFSWSPTLGFYKTTNRFQQWMSHVHLFLVWFAGGFRILSALFAWSETERFGKMEYGSTPSIFYVALSVISNIYVLYTTYIIRDRINVFEWMLSPNFSKSTSNFSTKDESFQENNCKWWSRYLPGRRLFGVIFIGLAAIGKSVDLISSSSKAFKFSTDPLVTVVPTIIIIIITVWDLHLINVLSFALTSFVEHRVKLFLMEVSVNDRQQISKMLANYVRLKDDFRKINNSFGVWFLFTVLTGMPFHCLEIQRLLYSEGQTLGKCLTIVYVILTFITLEFAAEANHLVGKAKDWIEKEARLNDIPSKELMVLLHGLGNDNIGLQGGKFFTMSYQLMTSVFGIILTYTIIILQWKRENGD